MNKSLIMAVALVAACRSPAWAAERWEAISTTAMSITGNITIAPEKITFAGGKSLPLAAPVRLSGFSAGGQKVAAALYKVAAPADLQLIRGNRLCDGRAVTYIVVWTPKFVGSDVALRSMSPFSGSKVPTGDADRASCGVFNYEAGH